MFAPRSCTPLAALVCLGLCLVASCKGDADTKEQAPSFEPGAMVDKTLAEVGGVTLKVPDNVAITETANEAKLEAEGFPTVTIVLATGEFNGTGTSVSRRGDNVEGRMTIPTKEWTCSAESAGDHTDLITSICESLAAPVNPNVGKLECKTIEGFDAEPVAAAWAATADAFTKCLSPLEGPGFGFGFNLVIDGDSRNMSKWSSPIIDDEAASTCMNGVYDELQANAAFTKEGLSAAKAECDGSYSRY